MSEIVWRKSVYHNCLMVSNKNLLFHKCTKRYCKGYLNRDGYRWTKISHVDEGTPVYFSREVAGAFHGYSRLTVNHINENKDDNRPENLEYVSQKVNNQKKSTNTVPRSKRRLSKDQLQFIVDNPQMNNAELGRKFGFDRYIIRQFRQGRTYKWFNK